MFDWNQEVVALSERNFHLADDGFDLLVGEREADELQALGKTDSRPQQRPEHPAEAQDDCPFHHRADERQMISDGGDAAQQAPGTEEKHDDENAGRHHRDRHRAIGDHPVGDRNHELSGIRNGGARTHDHVLELGHHENHDEADRARRQCHE